MDTVLKIVPVSYIAKNFFGKSRSWLHNKLNGNLSNGKPASLSLNEMRVFQNALEQLSREMNEAALTIGGYISKQTT